MMFIQHWVLHCIFYFEEMYIYWMWDIFVFTEQWKWKLIYLLLFCLFFLGVIKVLKSVKVIKVDAKLYENVLKLTKK